MLAKDAEAQGAFGVVVNAPMRNQTVETMKKVVDIPIIATVTSEIMISRQDWRPVLRS